MSGWACPADHRPLDARGDALVCAHCRARYPLRDGVPAFDPGLEQGDGPSLSTLRASIERAGWHVALDEFARRHGYLRESAAADWRFWLPLPERARVLELGAGLGDDTLALAARASRVVAAVPLADGARILSRRLETASGTAVEVVVLADAGALPLADGALDAIVIEDLAAAAFGLSRDRVARAAAEWRRVLVPRGVVLLAAANPLYRLPGLARLESALRSRGHPRSLSRAIKGAGSRLAARPATLRTIERSLVREGFSLSRRLAPLPDERRPEAVVPLDRRAPARHFLKHMVRRDTLAARLGLGVAQGLLGLGLLGAAVPYYYVVYRAPR